MILLGVLALGALWLSGMPMMFALPLWLGAFALSWPGVRRVVAVREIVLILPDRLQWRRAGEDSAQEAVLQGWRRLGPWLLLRASGWPAALPVWLPAFDDAASRSLLRLLAASTPPPAGGNV